MIYVTNGCFDLLHAGHRHFFKEVHRHMDGNDMLRVYINDDASVRNLKGNSRPIVREDERMKDLSEFLMGMFLQDGGKFSLRKTINPLYSMQLDTTEYRVVYAKDAESGIDGPEARWALNKKFHVLSIPRLPGVSTTDIINRVLHAANQGNTSGS